MTALMTNGASAALPTSQMGLGSFRTVVTATQALSINPGWPFGKELLRTINVL
jgi:hypothetical protein